MVNAGMADGVVGAGYKALATTPDAAHLLDVLDRLDEFAVGADELEGYAPAVTGAEQGFRRLAIEEADVEEAFPRATAGEEEAFERPEFGPTP